MRLAAAEGVTETATLRGGASSTGLRGAHSAEPPSIR